MNPDLAEVLERLNVERYSRSVWWSRQTVPTIEDPAICAARLATLEAEYVASSLSALGVVA